MTYETYQKDVDRAETAPATRNDMLAKRFGLPMEGYTYYFTYEETLPHRRQRFRPVPVRLLQHILLKRLHVQQSMALSLGHHRYALGIPGGFFRYSAGMNQKHPSRGGGQQKFLVLLDMVNPA